MQEIHEALAVGAVVHGRYIVVEVLDRGEFSVTYRVKDKRNAHDFLVLKELLISNSRVQRHIPPEVVLLKRLHHPALPRVLDVFNDDVYKRAYVLTSYIKGRNLDTFRLTQLEQHVSPSQAISLLGPIMDAVAYLHQQQPPIIHYSIKPANIIIREADAQPVLVGFDLAQQYNVRRITRIQPEKQCYDAPEQYHTQGTISPTTDIYALGATVYTLLSGSIPPDALSRQTHLRRRLPDPLVPLSQLIPSLPTAIVTTIHRAMAINSSERFATVEQFQTALGREITVPLTPVPAFLQRGSYKSSYQERVMSVLPKNIPFTSITLKNIPRFQLTIISLSLILLLIIGTVTGLLYNATSQQQPQPSPRANAVATSTASVVRSKTVATPAPLATPFPMLAKLYIGTIHDFSQRQTTEMMLTDVQQQQATISGNFKGLSMSSSFTGSISASGHIQFILAQNMGQKIVAFDGMIRSDHTISGTFCSSLQPANCGDYGIWSIST